MQLNCPRPFLVTHWLALPWPSAASFDILASTLRSIVHRLSLSVQRPLNFSMPLCRGRKVLDTLGQFCECRSINCRRYQLYGLSLEDILNMARSVQISVLGGLGRRMLLTSLGILHQYEILLQGFAASGDSETFRFCEKNGSPFEWVYITTRIIADFLGITTVISRLSVKSIYFLPNFLHSAE